MRKQAFLTLASCPWLLFGYAAEALPDTHIRPWMTQCPADYTSNFDPEEVSWVARDEVIQKALVPKVSLFVKRIPEHKELHTAVAFTTSSNGEMKNIRLLQRSDSECFNAVCLAAVRSLAKSSLLDFPKGSHYQKSQDYVVFSIHKEKDGLESRSVPSFSSNQLESLLKKTPSEISEVLRKP